MPLSDREQELLEEMERQLYGGQRPPRKPEFVEPGQANPRRLVLGIVGAIAGIGVVFAGIASSMSWLGFIGFALMVVSLAWGLKLTGSVTRDGQAPATPSSTSSQTSSNARSSKPGFMDRMNDRWDRRQYPES